MGFILPDIARTEADFEACRRLIGLLEPQGGMVAPIGEQRGNVTYIIRDEDDRSQIHALIHAETALEVRHMICDPAYKHSQISFTVLQRGMEMNMRANGVTHYYFAVPRENKRVIGIFEKDGATVIDTEVTRFIKRL